MDIKYIDNALLKSMFKQGTIELKRNIDIVNDLNVFPVPDGDTGTNMSLTMESAIENMKESKTDSIESLTKAISKGSLMGARGNSGVILSQIFRGFAKGCEKKETLTATDFAKALDKSADTAYNAVMKPVEGTILTVIRVTAEKVNEFVNKNTTIDDVIDYTIKVAEKTLEETPEHLKVLKQAGVVDAGGKGLVCIFHGFKDAIYGKELLDDEIEVISKKEEKIKSPEDIRYGYCTEFILQGTSIDGEKLKKQIEKLGDSMVFVQNDDIVKIHVHTNNPGIALEYALEEGELIKIKIDNMRKQHEEIIANQGHEVDDEVEMKAAPEENKDDFGFLAVSLGEGLSAIFKDLGVTKIIKGGQTMNPSTKDLLEKIDEINAENIIILPNNSNIIMAAEQAKEMSDKNVFIVNSKSIPQGISALIEFNPNASPDENIKNMNNAIKNIKTLEVTYSVKDTSFDDIEIKEGQIIGVSGGEIVSVGEDIHDISLQSIKKLIDEDTEIVTIYYGDEISEERANNLAKEIEELLDFGEVETYYGGQPLYYYLISVE